MSCVRNHSTISYIIRGANYQEMRFSGKQKILTRKWIVICYGLNCVPPKFAHCSPNSQYLRMWLYFGVCVCVCVCWSLSHVLLFATCLPGSSVHGILQVTILEWVVIPFSRGSSWPRDWTQVSYITGRFFTIWANREAIDGILDVGLFKKWFT